MRFRKCDVQGGKEWDKCVRGAALVAVDKLRPREGKGKNNAIRKLLISVLEQHVLDWTSCSGIVNRMIQNYAEKNEPTGKVCDDPDLNRERKVVM